MTFHRNDRVIIREYYGPAALPGQRGIVRATKEIGQDRFVYAVEFEDKHPGRSDCERSCAAGRGLWLPARVLEQEPGR